MPSVRNSSTTLRSSRARAGLVGGVGPDAPCARLRRDHSVDLGIAVGRDHQAHPVEVGRLEWSSTNFLAVRGVDVFAQLRSDEADALASAGVEFEIVPGITSSIAAPAAAGIPVTYRGVSAAFTVVTGHRRAGEPDVDWRSLARVGGTIVVLVGVSQRTGIAAELLAGGLDRSTPVAAVESATTDAQIVGRWTLAELAAADIHSPAVIVIGAVAAFEFVAHDLEAMSELAGSA